MKRILILVIVTMSGTQLLEAGRSRAGRARSQQAAPAAQITQAQTVQHAAASSTNTPTNTVERRFPSQRTYTTGSEVSRMHPRLEKQLAISVPETGNEAAYKARKELEAKQQAHYNKRQAELRQLIGNKQAIISAQQHRAEHLVSPIRAALTQQTDDTQLLAVITAVLDKAYRARCLHATLALVKKALPTTTKQATYTAINTIAKSIVSPKEEAPAAQARSWFSW